MKPVLFLQNITLETPGLMIPFLEKRNISYEIIDLYANEKIKKSPSQYGAVVVLGGPMNVDEEEKFPFLKAEKEFIRQSYKEHVPVLGVCLGGQLMAAAAGAKVKKNEVPEIGWMEVELTGAGKTSVLFEGIESPFPVFQWHGDTFEVPDGGIHLAYSRHCQHQAFSIQNQSYGLQFHIEVDEDDAKNWAEAYIEDVNAQSKVEVKDLIDKPNRANAGAVAAISEKLLYNFFTKQCG